MIAQIVGISIDILIILAIVYFVYRSFKKRTEKNKWPRIFIASIIVAIIFIPATIFSLSNAISVVATPIPTIKVPNSDIAITGTNTTGTLRGKTTPDTLVTLKEDVDKDEDPEIKTAYSNKKGTFIFKKLTDNMDYKIFAKNKYHKSKVVKISVGDIPKAAYTKFNINGSDDMGELHIKSDDNNQATINGTAEIKSKITIEDTNFNTVKVIKPDNNGKWSFTLDGPKKKSTDYTLYAKVRNRLESDNFSVYIKNPKYVKDESKETSNTSSKNKKESSQNDSLSTDSSQSQKKSTSVKNKKSEAEQGFEDDLNTYLGNKYPEVSFTVKDGMITFIVPDDVTYLSKKQMKAYFKPIDDRIELFASANGLNSIPTFIAQTNDGTAVARTTLSGYKVYSDD